MKNGKRPTKAQKSLLRYAGLAPDDWLISKNTSTETVVVHRFTGCTRTIPKRRDYNE